VVSTDPATGDVIVGGRDELATHEVHLRRVRVLDEQATLRPVLVQLRYRTRDCGNRATLVHNTLVGDASDGSGSASGDGVSIGTGEAAGAVLRFVDPISAPAPGQLACLYDEHDVVIASGTITRAR